MQCKVVLLSECLENKQRSLEDENKIFCRISVKSHSLQRSV